MQKPKRFSRKSTAQGNQSTSKQVDSKVHKNYQKFHGFDTQINHVLKYYKSPHNEGQHAQGLKLVQQSNHNKKQKRSKSEHKRGEDVSRLLNLDQKQFIDLYKNDPFAKRKLDYLIKKNEEKLMKDKALQNLVKTKYQYSGYQISNIGSQSRNNQSQQNSNQFRSFTKCKSQSDLLETERCLFYKDLIVSSQQSYSGVSD